MEVSDQLHAPAVYFLGKKTLYPLNRRRDGLELLEKRKNLLIFRKFLHYVLHSCVFSTRARVLPISMQISDAGKFRLKSDEVVWFVEFSVAAWSVLCFILAGRQQWFLSRSPSGPLICCYLRRQTLEFVCIMYLYNAQACLYSWFKLLSVCFQNLFTEV